MRKVLTIAGAALFGLAGSVWAEPPKDAAPGVDANANLKAPLADKNSDGKITKSEASGNKELTKQFTKLDTNKDGSLDMSEYAAFEASASGDNKSNPDVPGTTDDSVPGNKDKPGPAR
jgi:hypothetical protein